MYYCTMKSSSITKTLRLTTTLTSLLPLIQAQDIMCSCSPTASSFQLTLHDRCKTSIIGFDNVKGSISCFITESGDPSDIDEIFE
mmetsp:Transcript_10544/g.19059  ORF Transcript_10544/g.19059 Transcript_10544/m.19059 type:complete len:85 (-) Transcript_10544:471-725(-)